MLRKHYERDGCSKIPDRSHYVIEPARRFELAPWNELWDSRELLYFLVWSSWRVRYKQTALGILWAVIPPIATMIAMSVFFGRLANISSNNVPYPVFAFSGLILWTYFANAFAQISGSLRANEGILTKVYFPRLLIALAPLLAGLADLVIELAVLAGLMALYGLAPPVSVLSLPIFVGLAAFSALALGLWFASLGVAFRDVQFAAPFVLQVGLFVTPIAYPSDLVPERWHFVYGLNPMSGAVEGVRWALFGQAFPAADLLAGSLLMTALLLAGGLVCFRQVERTFADIV